MKILGKEVEFDFYDADNMERLDRIAIELEDNFNKINNQIGTLKMSELINEVYKNIAKAFDELFGEGSAKIIFEGKKNFKLCVQAMNDLAKARQEQDEELEDLVGQYTPTKNARRKKE